MLMREFRTFNKALSSILPQEPNGLSHAAGLQFSAGPAALIPLYLPVRLVGNEALILTTPIVGQEKNAGNIRH